ncbi:hypothetical protein [Variovorax paradoxus]|uniref:Uncharacterized protein n=1 Tax=Variovorax paradoxus TaxID=34073 RepID=A0A0H2LWU4_VARPD|nr:hypothetical protein [Variovorax paradoxus]KLN54713.1 hypothetical protein VPARA_40170 [Variovorax paradoxus]
MSSAKVNANSFMFFLDFHRALFEAIREGKTVETFTHTWGGGSGFGDGPQLDIEFEVRITKFNGEAMPRITQRMLQSMKKEEAK